MAKEFNLDELKQRYKKLQEKHNLPEFEKLNREFYIEKIAESETDFLFRELRKFIADKFYNYMRFIETILNPTNAPIFIFSVIKSVTSEQKKRLGEIYDKLSEVYLEVIRLDVDSSEKKDADFVKNAYNSWLGIKTELMPILEKLKNTNSKGEENSNNKYFG